MSKERDSKKRIAFPIQLFDEGSASVEIPSEIHVVPVGEWDHSLYGHMKIDAAAIQQFIANYEAGIRKDLRVTAGHDNGMSGGELPALGWFKKLYAKEDGLWAQMEWTPDGEEAIKNRSYKYFSPEMFLNGDLAYEDPETHNIYNYVLDGGALTNFPYFKELNAVVKFSDPHLMNKFNNDMQLKDILAKKPSELSEAEKTFLREHKGELSSEQTATFSSVFEEPAPVETVDEPEQPKAPETPEEPKVSASEKNKVVVSSAEFSALQQMANKGAEALKKIEATERKAKIDKLVFSATNTAGRFLPKHQSALEAFMVQLSEKQQGEFVALIGDMPTANTKQLFDELGDGGKNLNSAAGIYSEIKNLADAKVTASQGKLSFSDALRQVYSEKPELKTSYESALAAEGKN
jgi:phage I-like protein